MTLRDVDYKTLSDALFAYAGTSLDRRRAALLEARLEKIARSRGMDGVEPLIDGLRNSDNPAELIDDLVNCETSFFRDTPAFAALREYVIPQAMIKRDKVRRLRVLCAGCSTGQEAYSVAMMVREYFPELARWSVEITGIDVSMKRVERAAEGRYSEREVQRGVPRKLVPKYFQKDGDGLRMTAALRAFTQFRRANLTEAWPGLTDYDIVLLRNVLIYLDDTAKAAMLLRARDSLQNNGFLLLGAAETVAKARDAFRRAPWSGYPVYQRYDH
jgi:chemotaxis protein methyltransferase CheR